MTRFRRDAPGIVSDDSVDFIVDPQYIPMEEFLAHWHPHVHAIVADGVSTLNGSFIPYPEMAAKPFLIPNRRPVQVSYLLPK